MSTIDIAENHGLADEREEIELGLVIPSHRAIVDSIKEPRF